MDHDIEQNPVDERKGELLKELSVFKSFSKYLYHKESHKNKDIHEWLFLKTFLSWGSKRFRKGTVL